MQKPRQLRPQACWEEHTCAVCFAAPGSQLALSPFDLQVGKAYATRASRAANKKEALALQEEGFARLEAVFSRGSYAGMAVTLEPVWIC